MISVVRLRMVATPEPVSSMAMRTWRRAASPAELLGLVVPALRLDDDG
jgi:hypothetical protein